MWETQTKGKQRSENRVTTQTATANTWRFCLFMYCANECLQPPVFYSVSGISHNSNFKLHMTHQVSHIPSLMICMVQQSFTCFTLCFVSLYVLFHFMFCFTLCFVSLYVLFHFMFCFTLCFVSLYVLFHFMFCFTLCFVSLYVLFHFMFCFTLLCLENVCHSS